MNNTPKDHYIPQCYLDAFASEGSGEKNPHIYQYMDDKVVSPRIKDVASEKHYYTFTEKDTGKPSRVVDDFFTQIEGSAAGPLKKIICEEDINLTSDELGHLAVFFAVLAVRTPGFIKTQESFQGEALKELHAVEASNKDLLRKRCNEVGIALSEEELGKYQDFVLKKEYDISFNEAKAYFVGRGLEFSMTFAQWYHQKKYWHLLVASGDDFFITSDNPISVYRPVFVPPVFNAGYGNGTLIIPISPKLALLLRDVPLKNKVFKINSYFVKKINNTTIRFSDNYIYANQKSKKMETLFKKTERKAFQKIKVTRMGWAPFTFMGPPPVPEEPFK